MSLVLSKAIGREYYQHNKEEEDLMTMFLQSSVYNLLTTASIQKTCSKKMNYDLDTTYGVINIGNINPIETGDVYDKF